MPPEFDAMESPIEAFVDKFAKNVERLGPSEWTVGGQCLSDPLQVVCLNLPLNDLAGELSTIVGNEIIAKFFEPRSLSEPPAELEVVMYLVKCVQTTCVPTRGKRFQIDRESLRTKLTQFVACAQSGEIDVTISLRLSNVDITEDFEFVDGFRFRKISVAELARKYPINRFYTGLPGISESNWTKHRVEVVVPRRGTPAEMQLLHDHDHTEALIHSILHAFVLSGICNKGWPHVTHVYYESPLDCSCLLHSVQGIGANPILLSESDIAALISAYSFLKNAPRDPTLEAAVDRFLVGRKRSKHHPNRVNEANWDKVVDYVIALESLFLTANGSPMPQELSYRFRLNGSSLLHAALGADLRKTFHALRHLYDLRSKVVHGSGRSASSVAGKFLDAAGIDWSKSRHGQGQIGLVCKQVEEWLPAIFFHLSKIAKSDRPYTKSDGWEDMIWSSANRLNNE
jgi:hypothetical protein